ncbi:putative transglutaminase-like cysteine proteinase [Rhizobium halophytocola]|uniref:Transglutaminase-like cysteine proteinase n=1 Tax=Rhizobium halophytocola TaxID=735519 RepID=A0ABS4DZW0_9HYPH|nr:putative transglutaminase-like cysteine proteinase [Rhizobium halophytocola]
MPTNKAFTAPVAQPSMVTGGLTSQPIGHYEFCKTHESECSIRSTNTSGARLTEHGWQVVRQVNLQVNEQIRPMTDQQAFGRNEYWAYPVTVGDCEDYVLLKRRDLMEAGIKPTDLLITVVRKPDGEGHAVLTLRTTDGDFILDNLNDEVRPWYATAYTYLKRQAENDTGRWVTIENGRDVLVGALR